MHPSQMNNLDLMSVRSAALMSPSRPSPTFAAPAAGQGDYRVSVATTLDDGPALELWQHAQAPLVFNHPAWWRAAIDAFGGNRPLRVLQVHAGATLVALWPLWLKRLGPREMLTRILEPVGARVTDYCAPLLRAGNCPRAMLRLLLREASLHLDAQTLLLWPKAPLSADEPDLLQDLARADGLLCAGVDHPCPAMSLPPTYAELEKRWSKSHRGDVRRQIKRLNLAGKLELVTAADRADVMNLLPRLYAMHTANWRARAGSADLEDGPMTAFIARLAATLPMELIHASEVRLDGAAIGSHFGFRLPHALLWYKPTFDVAWASYAPGKVHIALAARQAIEEGQTVFDFMQGNEPYKQLWSDLTTPTKSFALARPMAYPMFHWNTAIRRFSAEYRL